MVWDVFQCSAGRKGLMAFGDWTCGSIKSSKRLHTRNIYLHPPSRKNHPPPTDAAPAARSKAHRSSGRLFIAVIFFALNMLYLLCANGRYGDSNEAAVNKRRSFNTVCRHAVFGKLGTEVQHSNTKPIH
jgi:hypothetical protein